LGATLRCAVMLVAVTISAQARDCSVSKEFRLRHPQALAGVFEDPAGAVMSGIELELLSGKIVIRHLRTDNQGKYDFGQIPSGKYRVHVQSGGNALCAPKVKCGTEGCTLKPKLTPNPKSAVTVY
jgi:hypothetical protein